MARKTRRHRGTKRAHASAPAVMTIPEVRRAFEHIEAFLHECHLAGNTQEEMTARVRKEWRRVFHKELTKASAEKLVTSHLASHKSVPRRTTRKRGGAVALMGSPLGAAEETRVGSYHYGSAGGMGEYFLSGLGSRPQSGMTDSGVWPSPDSQMGSNAVVSAVKQGGGRRGVRRPHGGGLMDLVRAAWDRPTAPASPPGPLFDAATLMKGQLPGASPNQLDRAPHYQTSSLAKPMTF